MADQRLHLLPDADLEAALRGLADAIDRPVAAPSEPGAPDLATVVRRRIEAGVEPRPAQRAGRSWRDTWRDTWRSWRPVRRVLVVALLALLAVALLAALAGAAGLGIPGIRIE